MEVERGITGSSQRELQHSGTESHFTAEGTIPLVEMCGKEKGINLPEPYGAAGVHARTAAGSAGPVLGNQVS